MKIGTFKHLALAGFLLFVLSFYNNCSSNYSSRSVALSSKSNDEPNEQSNTEQLLKQNLVAYYDFNQIRDNYIEDLSGQNDLLQVFGNGIVESNELKLNGIDTFAETTSIAELLKKIEGLTLSVLAKTDNNDNGLYHLVALGDGEENQALWVGRHGQNLRAGIFGETPIEILNFFSNENLNKYYLFTLTYDGLVFKLYIDGQLSGTIISDSLNLSSAKLRIAKRIDNQEKYWSGISGQCYL